MSAVLTTCFLVAVLPANAGLASPEVCANHVSVRDRVYASVCLFNFMLRLVVRLKTAIPRGWWWQ